MVARPWVWGGVLAASLLVAGTGSAAGAKRSAIIRGTVLVAPAAPVCMPQIPCMRPGPGIVLAFKRGDRIRARVTTAADGSYRVALVPGTYAVRVAHPTGINRLTPSVVRAVGGEARQVTFYLDTGIR